MNRQRIPPGPGQESVWDYPRPPRLERVPEAIKMVLAGEVVVESNEAWRVLETSHPPVYYIPKHAVRVGILVPGDNQSWCEWKGKARYFGVAFKDRMLTNVAWFYPTPTPAFESIRGHLAFYPQEFDACYVGDEQVQAQAGGFYGGWITSKIVGPFKGEPGTHGW